MKMDPYLKKQIIETFIDVFLPVFMVTWAVCLGIFSFVIMAWTLWSVFSIF